MRAQVLGLPLDQALALLREEGLEPRVTQTAAPGDRRTGGGTLRVVRASDTELVTALFQDAMPVRTQDPVQKAD